MDLTEAADRYHRAVVHCDNLILVHRRAGKGVQGRRFIEISVNRAVIVIAVATWQSAAQDLTTVLLDASMPPKAASSYGVASLIAGQVKCELGRFSTPNAENTRSLLQGAGYDPRLAWTWKLGRHGRTVLRTAEVETRLRDWLKVRHAIAHGDEQMPRVDVLEAVRSKAKPTDEPNIWLIDAVQCLNFMRRLTQATANGVADHLGVSRDRFDTGPASEAVSA